MMSNAAYKHCKLTSNSPSGVPKSQGEDPFNSKASWIKACQEEGNILGYWDWCVQQDLEFVKLCEQGKISNGGSK